MMAMQLTNNADHCLVYKDVGDTKQYFNDKDQQTVPRNRGVDPLSFQKAQAQLKSGNYHGIALIKNGKAFEHLPGGKPAEQKAPGPIKPVEPILPAIQAKKQTTPTADDFSDLPKQMVEAKRWLVWKSEPNPDPAKKPRKVPHYVNGKPRSGQLDSAADIASLTMFDDALRVLQTGLYAGLGFALGQDGTGNCWQGIDLDDLPTRPELQHLADNLPGYTEQSPSGRGVHAIGYGRPFSTLGSNGTGIEAYSSARYFTVTADGAGLHSPCDLADFVETQLRPTHGRSKPSTSSTEPKLVETVAPQTVTELRSALLFMRADDRDLWVKTGHALKALGNVGRGLWLEWSSTSDKFDAADAAKKWDTFRPTQTDYRAVFAEAQRQGWVNPLSNTATSIVVTNRVEKFGATNTPTPEFVNINDSSFVFMSAGDLVREPKPVEYLIDELIEHPSLLMLFGAPSAGKSFVALSMAACVATGQPWLGRDVRKGSVFYLAGEGQAGVSRRLRAWEIETGVSLEGAPLFVSKMPAQLMDIKNAQMVEQAINELCVKHGTPALIVIDTLARNMGSGDESSNADISQFVAAIDGMRHRLGCTVELVHHSGHLESERARGASALPAAMDASFQMDAKGGGRALVHKKSKESELAAPIPLKLKEVPIGWKDMKGREIRSAVVVETGEQAPEKIKSLTSRQKDGLQSLCKAVVDQNALAVQDGEWLGINVETWRVEFYRTCTADDKKKAFQRVRDNLKNRGLVRIDSDICYVRQSEPSLIAQNLTANMQDKGHGT